MSTVYTIDIKHVEEGDDLYMQIPDELMEDMGWEIGDDLKFIDHKDGSFRLRKVKYETIELEFDDEDLFKYMHAAHKKDITLNEFIAEAVEERISTDKI